MHFPRTQNGINHDDGFGFPDFPRVKKHSGVIDTSSVGTKLWMKMIIRLLKSDILELGG